MTQNRFLQHLHGETLGPGILCDACFLFLASNKYRFSKRKHAHYLVRALGQWLWLSWSDCRFWFSCPRVEAFNLPF